MDGELDLLHGHRFQVASYGIAAAYAGCLLRQFGASVAHETVLDPESVGAFFAPGARVVAEPALTVDSDGVLITDAPVNAATRAALGKLAASARVIWITPWGLQEPWSSQPATDLTLYAATAWMNSVGNPDREPLAPPGGQGPLVASQYAAIMALDHFARPGGARSNALVDIAIAEVMVASLIYTPVSHQYSGRLGKRAGNRYATSIPLVVTLPCKDGFVGIHAPLERQWDALCKVIGQPQLTRDPRFESLAVRTTHLEPLDEYLCAWLSSRTRFEIYHELQRARIPASAHPDTFEVLNSPHLAARNYWRTATTPAGRSFKVPGPPARVLAVSKPRAGEQTRSSMPAELPPWRPGRLRVADLSMGWAGPLVTQMLAAFGADVIKIEGPQHFDWWRGFADPAFNPDAPAHELSATFNTVNRGKRAVMLDFAVPEQMAAVRQLIAGADVVVENFGPGVLEKLGLTYDVLSADNPRLVMVRLPGMGSGGPESDYRTFGNTIEGMSGLSTLVGYPDGPPLLLPNAFGDPVAGLNGTLAVLAALASARRDGCGRLIECSQLEGFIPFIGEALAEAQLSRQVPARRGNQRVGSIVSDALPCRGEDVWLVIEIDTEPQWQRFAALIGEPWMQVADVATDAGRAALLQRLRAWTGAHDRDTILALCRRAGVSAAPVNNEADVLSLEPLVSRRFWYEEQRRHIGSKRYPSVPVIENGVRPQVTVPAPLLGEHSQEILAALAAGRS